MDKLNNLSLGVAPLIVILGCFLVYFKKDHYLFGVLPVLILNIYVLYLGVYTLVKGIQTQWIIQINAGLVVIAALILIRFFDIDISFIVKATSFIIIGTGFFITNFLLVKQMKKEKKPDSEGVVENV